jgi:hypothetical protein
LATRSTLDKLHLHMYGDKHEHLFGNLHQQIIQQRQQRCRKGIGLSRSMLAGCTCICVSTAPKQTAQRCQNPATSTDITNTMVKQSEPRCSTRTRSSPTSAELRPAVTTEAFLQGSLHERCCSCTLRVAPVASLQAVTKRFFGRCWKCDNWATLRKESGATDAPASALARR